jgi:hypothetical protein
MVGRGRCGNVLVTRRGQPTQVRVAGGVLVTSGGRRATLAGAAHGSGAAVKASTSIE